MVKKTYKSKVVREERVDLGRLCKKHDDFPENMHEEAKEAK